jgi:glycosyltransferase involved in cell wall biosynthesis
MYIKYTNILFTFLIIFINIIQFIDCKNVNVNEIFNKNSKREDVESQKGEDVESQKDPIKVSIIIPAYNSEQFIRRSLSSALNQTLSEIEVIVLNDHSTDNTTEIIKEYENDKRLRVFNLDQNKGPGVLRNIGIQLANGEFIGFIDSDDCVSEDFFEHLYDYAKDNDVVIGIFVNSTNDTNNYSLHPPFRDDGYGCVGDSIWRKSFIEQHNIKFGGGDPKMGEDLYFRKTFMSYQPRKVKASDNGSYYYYKRREGSLMNYTSDTVERYSETATLVPVKYRKHVIVIIIVVASCLSVVGLISALIIRRNKNKKESSNNELDENEGLIAAI